MNVENYCLFSYFKNRLFGQTTKQPLNNSEPQNPWKNKHLWGLRPDPSCLEKKISLIKIKDELLKQHVVSMLVCECVAIC